jgi:hypothetical protein
LVPEQRRKLVLALEHEMLEHAKNLEFEQAAAIRDEIEKIKDIGKKGGGRRKGGERSSEGGVEEGEEGGGPILSRQMFRCKNMRLGVFIRWKNIHFLDLTVFEGNLGIYKGAVYENIIADIFAKAGKKLYYFEYRSQIEIDFFIRFSKQAAAIEVKSADNAKSTNPRTRYAGEAERMGYGCSRKVFDSGYIPLVPPQGSLA